MNFLEREGHIVATASDRPSALAAVEEFRPDVAILETGMPGLNGFKVAEQIPTPSAISRLRSLSQFAVQETTVSLLSRALRFDAAHACRRAQCLEKATDA